MKVEKRIPSDFYAKQVFEADEEKITETYKSLSKEYKRTFFYRDFKPEPSKGKIGESGWIKWTWTLWIGSIFFDVISRISKYPIIRKITLIAALISIIMGFLFMVLTFFKKEIISFETRDGKYFVWFNLESNEVFANYVAEKIKKYQG